MFVPFQFRWKPLLLQCLRAFMLSRFITTMFLLLHSRAKTSFTSLAFLLSWSFQGVNSEISTLLLPVFMDFARLMMFSATCSGSVDVFKSFVPQCKVTLLGARSIVDRIYDSISLVVAPPRI